MSEICSVICRGNSFGNLDSKPDKLKDSGQVSELESNEVTSILAGRLAQLTTLTHLDLRRVVNAANSYTIHMMLTIPTMCLEAKVVIASSRSMPPDLRLAMFVI